MVAAQSPCAGPGPNTTLQRGSAVSLYDARFVFTGRLRQLDLTMGDDRGSDHRSEGRKQQARQ